MLAIFEYRACPRKNCSPFLNMMEPHEIYTIIDFELLAPYTLRLVFDDQTIQEINFAPLLKGELYAPLQDVALFNQVRLDPEVGTIVWPNGADFDPAVLHDWPQLEEAMLKMVASWSD